MAGDTLAVGGVRRGPGDEESPVCVRPRTSLGAPMESTHVTALVAWRPVRAGPTTRRRLTLRVTRLGVLRPAPLRRDVGAGATKELDSRVLWEGPYASRHRCSRYGPTMLRSQTVNPEAACASFFGAPRSTSPSPRLARPGGSSTRATRTVRHGQLSLSAIERIKGAPPIAEPDTRAVVPQPGCGVIYGYLPGRARAYHAPPTALRSAS